MSSFGDYNNDPTTDFFARERAVLGQDADIFTVNDNFVYVPNTFESNYPKAEHLESSKAFHQAMLPEEEPDVVRQWRENQRKRIAERDSEEQEKKAEVINRARQDIDRFYEEYNDRKQQAIEENRERQDNKIKASASTHIWTAVVAEIDTSNAKPTFPSRDVSRMKSLLLDLKKDRNAPGTIIYS